MRGADAEHKLFVGMIPTSATEKDLEQMFAPFGDLAEVAVLRHAATGESRG